MPQRVLFSNVPLIQKVNDNVTAGRGKVCLIVNVFLLIVILLMFSIILGEAVYPMLKPNYVFVSDCIMIVYGKENTTYNFNDILF
jgi:hypothetical protein